MSSELGPLQKALVQAGLAEKPKAQRKRFKKFNCRKCENIMIKVPDSNIMYCNNCGSYFLFDKVM